MSRSLPSYALFAQQFSSDAIEAQFHGNFTDGINVCQEICDRYASDASKVALRYQTAAGIDGEMTFAELQQQAARFANFLNAQGIGRGDRVACLLPRTPQLLICILGTLRAGAVYQPLFTAFGPGAIDYRLQQANTRLIVTNGEQWHKLDDVSASPLTMLVDNLPTTSKQPDFYLHEQLSHYSDDFTPVLLQLDDPFLQMFTSGTTGKPKGVAVPTKALMAFYVYMKYAIGLQADDQFWNLADPGWAYGLYYAIIGPLLLGVTTHFNEASFSADNTLAFLQRYRITNLAAAPTAYRLLMANDELFDDSAKLQVKRASSAGEPLSPEIVNWAQQRLGCRLCDQYGQTETGMTSANFHALEHVERPASMGFQLPGYRLVALDPKGNEVAPGESGELAVDMEHSPLFFFDGYTWNEKAPYQGRYYLTGDMVVSNGDGSHSYTGRDDDIIASAGYRIGPAEVESALIEHDAVIESAVVGKPDDKRGAIVKAYVVVRSNYETDQQLAEELQQHVRNTLSMHSYPREIEFVDELPKTSSGKIQRYLLRQQAEKEISDATSA
ncbi:AMP-binding protein [Bacterioplanes sanyensis]|uniref:AMP-binding protein n=1 Tax=Bacterioplanes sanyensis TaxID=1249553 RepID=A0A222FKN4_9GAMM|nr:AMP-binding protein [Bacterioplanes sanyensis]ASP39084.1 AMP-binding protein [Bacterioplanes sanyensis]